MLPNDYDGGDSQIELKTLNAWENNDVYNKAIADGTDPSTLTDFKAQLDQKCEQLGLARDENGDLYRIDNAAEQQAEPVIEQVPQEDIDFAKDLVDKGTVDDETLTMNTNYGKMTYTPYNPIDNDETASSINFSGAALAGKVLDFRSYMSSLGAEVTNSENNNYLVDYQMQDGTRVETLLQPDGKSFSVDVIGNDSNAAQQTAANIMARWTGMETEAEKTAFADSLANKTAGIVPPDAIAENISVSDEANAPTEPQSNQSSISINKTVDMQEMMKLVSSDKTMDAQSMQKLAIIGAQDEAYLQAKGCDNPSPTQQFLIRQQESLLGEFGLTHDDEGNLVKIPENNAQSAYEPHSDTIGERIKGFFGRKGEETIADRGQQTAQSDSQPKAVIENPVLVSSRVISR